MLLATKNSLGGIFNDIEISSNQNLCTQMIPITEEHIYTKINTIHKTNITNWQKVLGDEIIAILTFSIIISQNYMESIVIFLIKLLFKKFH